MTVSLSTVHILVDDPDAALAFYRDTLGLVVRKEVAQGDLRWIILVNPMTPIVEAFRYAFLGAGSLDLGHLLYSFGFMVVVVLLGSLIFNRVEQTFMDTV